MTIAHAPEPTPFPSFAGPAASGSLLRKHLTAAVWQSLKDVKTASGVTLQDCIASGLARSDSAIGMYLGDEEALERFGLLLDPVIQDWHGCAPVHRTSEEDSEAGCVLPNLDPRGHFIRSTRIRLARNLCGYRLMPTITQRELLEVQALAQAALNGLDHDLAGSCQPLGAAGLPGFNANDDFQQAAGICRAWPQGRSVFSNPAQSLQVWVNEEDHLRIISLQAGADIGAVYARLLRASRHLERALHFQQSVRYGYLASCPSNLGTGLRASFHINLPLSGNTPEFKALCAQHAIAVRSVAGEAGRQQGDVFDISNRRRLGLSPIGCIQTLLAGTARMIALEKSLQA